MNKRFKAMTSDIIIVATAWLSGFCFGLVYGALYVLGKVPK